MKYFIKKLLRENLNIPKMSLAKNVLVSDLDKKNIISISWKDIDFEQLNEDSPVRFKVLLPINSDLSDGISLEIQLTRLGFYQPHLFISDNLKGLGLGYKIYVALIHSFGHLYSSKNRRINDLEIPKIWNKLSGESEMECFSNEFDNLCISDYAQNKEDILAVFNS
tara:strand:- start:903 stop:1400 length:498 start_codon:yes stop_codon:yes gene_type:complete